MDDANSQRPMPLPHIRSQADLYACWTTLMGPLGFTYPRLYLMLVTPDGSCDGFLTEIAELPAVPDPATTDGLLRMCADLIASVLPQGSRAAFLYARPGGGGVGDEERVWGDALTSSARREGVSMWPVHVANDDQLRVLAPDDLAQPA